MNKLLKLAIKYNLADGTRTLLTIFTIFIAAALVFIIIIITQTGINYFFSELLLFQPDQLVILPLKAGFQGASSGISYFSDKDFQNLLSFECLRLVYPSLSARAEYLYKNNFGSLNIIGSDYYLIDNELFISLKEGRRIEPSSQRVVVVGYNLWKNLDVKIGDNIIIQNKSFRIIGILDKSQFQSTDDQIFMSLQDAKNLFSDRYNAILGRYYLECDEDYVVEEIKLLLTKSGRDVTVISSKFVRENIGGILNIISIAGVFLSLISSFIASFGITNTILASIIRRKKQIAVMKAIGANDREIIILLIYQISLLIIAGILLALGLALVFSWYLNNFIPVFYRISDIILSLIVLYLASIIIPIFLAVRIILSISPIEALKD